MELLLLSLVLVLTVHNSKSGPRFQPILFDFHRKHRLSLPSLAKTQSTQVGGSLLRCLTECVQAHWCQSCNFKTTPESNGLHVCELLSSDRFTLTNSLTKEEVFYHFNFKTPCHILNKPCINGGECIFKNGTFQCKCEEGLSGDQCQEGIWSQWSSWSHVGCHLPSICPQTRTRNCSIHSLYNVNCVGPKNETRQCPPLPVVDITNCRNPLGMQNGIIKDSQITASSYYTVGLSHHPHNGRLHRPTTSCCVGGWAAKAKTIGDFLQVDLINTKVITMVASQGRANAGQFVTKYALAYSNDGNTWRNYEGDCIKIFPGNYDHNSVVTNTLEKPITTRYIRIIVKGFTRHPTMRVELYGCTQL